MNANLRCRSDGLFVPTESVGCCTGYDIPLPCSQLLRRHIPTGMPKQLKPLHLAGQAASGPPCEALLRLAATALEACVTEGKPQLDLVPLFPTAGWADLAAGTPLRHHTSAGCTATRTRLDCACGRRDAYVP
jgi:hypothetical protein